MGTSAVHRVCLLSVCMCSFCFSLLFYALTVILTFEVIIELFVTFLSSKDFLTGTNLDRRKFRALPSHLGFILILRVLTSCVIILTSVVETDINTARYV